MKITPLVASRFVSDGGAMFGLVPKPIWSKMLPADERNGIPQNANVLLVELDNGRKGLIDTGCGDPAAFSDKELALHGMTREWPLMEALRARKIAPEQIAFVILTHLHWDHAGGLGSVTDNGPSLTFPNAHVYIHDKEWADAVSGNPLLYKSYPAQTIAPLKELPATQRRLVHDDDSVVFPGIRLIRSGGHTRGHCVVLIEDARLELDHPEAAAFGPVRRLLFAGDVCPTQHHLRMVFQAAYDTFPLDTRRWKRTWLPRVVQEDMALFFDHDPHACGARITTDEQREFRVTQTLPAR